MTSKTNQTEKFDLYVIEKKYDSITEKPDAQN